MVHPGRGHFVGTGAPRGGPGARQRDLGRLLSSRDHGDVHAARALRRRACRHAARPARQRRRGGGRRRPAVLRRATEPAARHRAGEPRLGPGGARSLVGRAARFPPRADGPLRQAGPMQLPATIFREYDIRGIVGDQLTADGAQAIGQGIATLGWERLQRAPRIAVGRDNRPSGDALVEGLQAGIAAAGGHAIDVGILPTPALYFATHVLEVDGGVQVTGSHNPPQFNGFKVVLSGEAVAGPEIQRLRRLIEDGDAAGRPGGTRQRDDAVLPRYRDAIAQRNSPLARRVKVVVDCGNGVSSVVAVDTLRQVGADVVPLFCESDGTFPNHHPDPTVVENLRDLQAAVRREQAELGGPLSRLLADLPATVSTPEVRVDCADEHKFAIVERAAQHFAARYPVSTLDGVRITFPDGWGLVRASNTQPVLVLRFEAGSESALAAYRAEVEDWLAAQGVRP